MAGAQALKPSPAAFPPEREAGLEAEALALGLGVLGGTPQQGAVHDLPAVLLDLLVAHVVWGDEEAQDG